MLQKYYNATVDEGPLWPIDRRIISKHLFFFALGAFWNPALRFILTLELSFTAKWEIWRIWNMSTHFLSAKLFQRRKWKWNKNIKAKFDNYPLRNSTKMVRKRVRKRSILKLPPPPLSHAHNTKNKKLFFSKLLVRRLSYNNNIVI